MTKLLVATKNKGKLEEYKQMLGDLKDIEWLSLWDVGLGDMEVEETGGTFAENARLKAHKYMEAAGIMTLADDSGLEVDALDGEPGVYSARYGGSDVSTDQERYEHLLEKLEALSSDDHSARFVCALAIARPGQSKEDIMIVQEAVEGKITYQPRGDNGFGYDPVFELPDGRTIAQLPADEKNRISHRGRALVEALPILKQYLGQA